MRTTSEWWLRRLAEQALTRASRALQLAEHVQRQTDQHTVELVRLVPQKHVRRSLDDASCTTPNMSSLQKKESRRAHAHEDLMERQEQRWVMFFSTERQF